MSSATDDFPPAFLVKARISPPLSVQWLRSQEAVKVADTVATAPFLAVVFSYPGYDEPLACDLILPVTNVEPTNGSYFTILDYDPAPGATNINEPFLSLPEIRGPIRLHALTDAIQGFRFSDARVGHPLGEVLNELLWLVYLDHKAESLAPIRNRNRARRKARYGEEVSSFRSSFSAGPPLDRGNSICFDSFLFEYSRICDEDLIHPPLLNVQSETGLIKRITENYAIQGIEDAIEWARKLESIDLQSTPRVPTQQSNPPSFQQDLLILQSFPIKYPLENKPQETQDPSEELWSWDDEFHISLQIAPDAGSHEPVTLNRGENINLLFIDILDTVSSRSASIISAIRSWIRSVEMPRDDQELLELYMHCEGLVLLEKPGLDSRSLSKKVLERMAQVMGVPLPESVCVRMVDAICSPPPRDGLLEDINSLRQSGCSVIALRNMDAETFETWCRRYGFAFCDSICQSTPDTCLEVLGKFKVNPANALVVSSRFYRDLEPILSVVPTAQIFEGMTEHQRDASAINGVRCSLGVDSWKDLYNSVQSVRNSFM